ncbi:MAG: TetR/AcrR family transcriptional regulator [Cucumibacter sp.]
MQVSSKLSSEDLANERGPRARTRRLMLKTAIGVMQSGVTPTVSEVAETAQVSRATAYRSFPSQAALIQAVVDEALGPILDWTSDSTDAAERVSDLLTMAMPHILEFEATFRASLKLSLEHWAKRQAGTLGDEPQFGRGHRVELLKSAMAPLRGQLSAKEMDRLVKSLALVFGIELIIVLKDMWNADDAELETVALWAARALVTAALDQSHGRTSAAAGGGKDR